VTGWPRSGESQLSFRLVTPFRAKNGVSITLRSWAGYAYAVIRTVNGSVILIWLANKVRIGVS